MLELIQEFKTKFFPNLVENEITKIDDFWEILENHDLDYNKSDMVDFLQKVFIKCERKASEECVTYDMSLAYDYPEIIEKYKKLVEELNPLDVPVTVQKLKEYTDSFFEEALALNNQLAIMINTKTKGNKDSLFKTFIGDGYKIDADSKIIGFIHSSLYDGYKTYEEEFFSSVNGRIAGIINADVIERVGYVTRKLGFLMKFTKLDGNHLDHGCEPSLSIFITKQNLNKFTGRYYYNIDKELKYLSKHSEVDKEYVLFSPYKCKSPGKHICATCFGKLSDNLKHLDSLGTISQPITQDVTQSLLSSKHFQSLNLPDHCDIEYLGLMEGVAKWKISKTSKLSIIDKSLVDEEGSTIPFMTRELVWLNENERIFTGNGEFYNKNTKSLVSVFEELFNKTRSFEKINTFKAYLTGMLKFDEMANLGENSILWELILMNICRVDSDPRLLSKQRPDEPYSIFSLQKGILKSGSMDSLFFERFKEQVSSPGFFLEPLSREGYGEFYFGKEKKRVRGNI